MENGWEWPDASAKVAVEFKLDIDELSADWDLYIERAKK